MSLTYGPAYVDTPLQNASQVSVLNWDGTPATLASPVQLLPNNNITFEVANDGRYLIRIKTAYSQKEYRAVLTTESYDPGDIRSYLDSRIKDLQEEIDAGGGGTGVSPNRKVEAGAGLTGGGDLSADRTLSLNETTLASLAKADTSVQPARAVNTGTGLTGGGNLSTNRTIALSAASIESLAKADTALQPGSVTPASIGAIPTTDIAVTTTANRIYGTGSSGAPEAKVASSSAVSGSVAVRGASGVLAVGTATANDHAVTKAQHDTKVANGGGISTVQRLTQAAYDALATKDANTLYVIVG